ncbi:MAG: formate dehydrogenase accessory sulfurtransferase FdhD [Verrucomicrobiota bacterium]
MEASQTISVTHCQPEGHRQIRDQVAVEEPLEIRLDGHPVAVVMRTPGHDQDLAAGFLVTEGIISKVSQLRKIEPRPEENRVLLFLQDHVTVDLGRLTRHFYTGSSCGLCGKATLDAIFTESPAIHQRIEISDAAFLAAPDKLRAAQSTFDTTGGLHAAGLFSETGELLAVREDIGRHNATDKVIGHALHHGLDLGKSFLLVSGRVSFEIMQKALAARIPAVAGISAPSSLAIDFAKASAQTLVGFLRPPTFNRYA